MKNIDGKTVSVAGEEEQLVNLVVDFANAPAPASAGEVERGFQVHPWVKRSPVWQSIDPVALGEVDADGRRSAASVIAFRNDRDQLRGALTEIAKKGPVTRIAKRLNLQERLGEALSGRIIVSPVKRGFAVGVEPALSGVGVCVWYALALLLDGRRDYAAGFTQCAAPRRSGEPCGRFFWRGKHRRRYCSAACTITAARAKTAARVKRHYARRGRPRSGR